MDDTSLKQARAARWAGKPEPLSVRLIESVCVVFALWTLCCYAAVLLGLTLSSLLWLFAVCLLSLRFLKIPSPEPEPEESAVSASTSEPEAEKVVTQGLAARVPMPRLLAGGLILALIVGGIYTWRPEVDTLWWLAVLYLAGAMVFVARERPRLVPAVEGPQLEKLLWVLAGFCVVVALVSHRPDADDAQYIDIAVSAADLPEWSLMSSDTLHGIPGIPLIQPIYKLHSYELWNGAMSYLTGIPAIYCFHWISASLAALLLPLAWARLFRILTPQRWLVAVGVFLFVLLAVGETHRWQGNFSLVRIWQGKALFLFVFMPMVYSSAIRFGMRPSLRDWILLSSAQIAALGSSSSALWCAPVGAAIAFISVWRPSRRSWPALILCGLASSVLVLAGLALKHQMMPYTVNIAKQDDVLSVSRLSTALEVVLGDGRLLLFSIAAVLCAWIFSRRALARRFLVCLPLMFLVFLFNPYTAKLVSMHVTGPSYWRSLWAVPVPLFITLLLLAPLNFATPRTLRAARLAVVLGALAFVAWIPRYSALSEENQVALQRPSLKVPPVEYDVAQTLYEAVGPRARVLVGGDVNPWITTMHRHQYPLVVRNYLSSGRIRRALGSQDVNRRRDLTRFVAGYGRGRGMVDIFRSGLDHYQVEGVCLDRSRRPEAARAVLDELGFQRIYMHGDYELWTRRALNP